MQFTYKDLLNSMSALQSQLVAPRPRRIKVTSDFYIYLEAIHKDNKFLYQHYDNNTLSYFMGILIVVDDTIDGLYKFEF